MRVVGDSAYRLQRYTANAMKESDVRIAAETRDQVGEGPVWIAAERALYWVDVLGPAINRLTLDDGALRRWSLPEPIGFLVPRSNQPGFVVGLQSGFHLLSLTPFRLELIGNPEPHLPENRLNDGKADALGRLWAGTMAMSGDRPSGTLYQVGRDRRWRAMETGYHVTNGPAFTPDQQWLYHADSPKRVIYRFRLDQFGNLREKHPFIVFPDEWGYPDGMTVDSEGHLWVAHWNGGQVSRFDPSGQRERSIALPTNNITSCAFGGDALDRLFVTSARQGCDDQPLAGALFELEPNVRGLPPGSFSG